jgi:uncharacterized protein (DUF1810 family)
MTNEVERFVKVQEESYGCALQEIKNGRKRNVPLSFPVLLIALGKATTPGHPTVSLPIQDVVFFNEIFSE